MNVGQDTIPSAATHILEISCHRFDLFLGRFFIPVLVRSGSFDSGVVSVGPCKIQ